MKQNMIFEGKTVDVAIEKACKELKVSKEKLKYEVVSRGSTGIFSIIGAKKAKIEVVLPSKSERIEEENHEMKAGAISLVDEAFSGKKEKPAAKKETPKKTTPKPVAKAPEEPVRNIEDESYEGFEDEEDDVDESMMVAVSELPEEIVEKGSVALRKISDAITEGATVRVEREKDRLVYNIEGGDASLLIGKRGQTLEAIQYLIDKLINRSADVRVRVQVDVGGYLETRKKNLEGLALRLAEKAKKTGKPSTIGQMTAHDRRIVHLALKDDNGVRTQSMGEGYYRRLVIFPKRNSNRRKKPARNSE